jgi:hypothetical protein
MVRARTTVRHLDAVWKIELMCKINLRNRVVQGKKKKKKFTSVTGTFTVVLLPSAATDFSADSTAAILIFRIALGGPPILLAKNTSSVSGTYIGAS